MPSKKRKGRANSSGTEDNDNVARFVCECEDNADSPHASELECKHVFKMNEHKEIAKRICLWSEKVSISVGSSQQLIHVDKDLLSLHSGHFRKTLADFDAEGEDRKQMSLSDVDPVSFIDFVCWMQHGNLIDMRAEDIDAGDASVEKLWLLGQILEAPGFQNFVIWDQLRVHWEQSHSSLLPFEDVMFTYEASERDSKLRRFYADLVACQNPFKIYGKETLRYQQWCDLFEEFPDLGLDVAKGSWQNDKLPWDPVRIGKYRVEEPDLDQAWEEMILKARPVAEIEDGARKGCIRSKLELRHIKRNQAVGEG